MTGRALLRLSPKSAKVTADRMVFDGIDLMTVSEREMRRIRGRRISMILQDPKYSLNPLMRVGRQITEAYRVHFRVSAREARSRALAMLESVHIRDPERVFDLYPHEISGGMGQRIMIATMLIPEPALVIADEPTSALDVTVRRQVLNVLDELVTQRGTSLMFISHDLELVKNFCDRVIVMYGGRIMEELPADRLHQASHPYTQALLASRVDVDRPVERIPIMRRDPAWLNAPGQGGRV